MFLLELNFRAYADSRNCTRTVLGEKQKELSLGVRTKKPGGGAVWFVSDTRRLGQITRFWSRLDMSGRSLEEYLPGKKV